MNTDLSPFLKYLPLLIPVIVLQLGLQIWALVDLARREATNGPKWLWAVIIIAGELLGPVIYFIAGRKE
jgi:hypothetical protein